MWKLIVGFALFGALAVYILTKSGGDIDMGGEKHEVVPAAAEVPAPGATPAASAASQ